MELCSVFHFVYIIRPYLFSMYKFSYWKPSLISIQVNRKDFGSGCFSAEEKYNLLQTRYFQYFKIYPIPWSHT